MPHEEKEESFSNDVDTNEDTVINLILIITFAYTTNNNGTTTFANAPVITTAWKFPTAES